MAGAELAVRRRSRGCAAGCVIVRSGRSWRGTQPPGGEWGRHRPRGNWRPSGTPAAGWEAEAALVHWHKHRAPPHVCWGIIKRPDRAPCAMGPRMTAVGPADRCLNLCSRWLLFNHRPRLYRGPMEAECGRGPCGPFFEDLAEKTDFRRRF